MNKFGVTSYNGNLTVVQPGQAVTQRSVHPPLAAIAPLQPAPAKPETQAKAQPQTPAQILVSVPDNANYVECVSVSLWEAYNLTEQDAQRSLQERRGSSLLAASSSK